RETSARPGRMAPVDLRSFERERLGWLARRRVSAATSRNHLVDRTGQPPSWQAGRSQAPPGIPPSAGSGAPDQLHQDLAPERHRLAGEQIRASLSKLLARD